MKKADRTLELVKTITVLCAIGAGALLGKSKYFGCKRYSKLNFLTEIQE